MSRPIGVTETMLGLLLASASPLLAQIDPFYLELERDAATAAARGEAERAARWYRLACFGMLEEPTRLAACTVRLAIEQAKAKDPEAFRGSFSRLATVEERFQGWTLADVTPEERSEFARLAALLLPVETLEAIPSVAALAASAKALSAPPSDPASGKGRRKSEAPPPVVVSQPERAAVDEALQEATTSVEEPPSPAPAEDVRLTAQESSEVAPATPVSLTEGEQAEVETARQLLAGRPERAEIDAAVASLRDIADRHPEAPEIAHLVGDLAYRLADWPLCADYYGRAGDPGPEAPLERFYMAVCLYETGQREAAAELLAPSAEQLKRSPFVDSYLAKILAPSGLP